MSIRSFVQVQSFQSINNKSARTLILGSMPGIKSLQAQQYYAHPRNAFWHIMQSITGIPYNADYQQRITSLSGVGIALWDVIKSCQRQGSLDADIDKASVCINDFASFFEMHSKLKLVVLNGSKAFQLFEKHVVKQNKLPNDIAYKALPSTSPAHASISIAQKTTIWLETLSEFL